MGVDMGGGCWRGLRRAQEEDGEQEAGEGWGGHGRRTWEEDSNQLGHGRGEDSVTALSSSPFFPRLCRADC